MRAGIISEVLVSRSHEVVWWTSTFDHAQKRHFFDSDNDYQALEGLRIRSMHSIGYREHVSLKRIIDHYELGKKFSRMARTEDKPDLIFCALPTLDFAVAAVRYGRKNKVPVVIDVRDLWPDFFLYTIPKWSRIAGKLALYPYFQMAKEACKGAIAITGVTPAFVEWGLKKAGRSQGSWDKDFPLAYKRATAGKEKLENGYKFWEGHGIKPGCGFIVAYFGLMGVSFDLEPVIRAAIIASELAPSVKFVLCGDGDRLEKYRKMAGGLDNVRLPGWVGAGEIQALMEMSSIGLSPLPYRPDFLVNINNKTIEYLSGGLPVLSSPTYGMVYEMLRDNECGLSYDQRAPSSLALAVEGLSRNPERVRRMSENAKRLYEEKFVAEKVYSEMATHLEMIAKSSK
jgi:glycosyltransferase involved in cell wall biosynthesis